MSDTEIVIVFSNPVDKLKRGIVDVVLIGLGSV